VDALDEAGISYELDEALGVNEVSVRRENYRRGRQQVLAKCAEDIKEGRVTRSEDYLYARFEGNLADDAARDADYQTARGELVRALASLNFACRVMPWVSDWQFERAVLKKELGDFEGAMTDLREIIDRGHWSRTSVAVDLLKELESGK